MRGDERTDLEREEQVARALRRPVRDQQLPTFPEVEARLRRRAPGSPIVVALLGVVVLGLIVGGVLAQRRMLSAQPGPVPTAAASPSPLTWQEGLVADAQRVQGQLAYWPLVPTYVPVEVRAQVRTRDGCGISASQCLDYRFESLTGTLVLQVLQGPAGCCLDAARPGAVRNVDIRPGVRAQYDVEPPQFGGPILWWVEDTARGPVYVALNSPVFSEDELIRIASSMRPLPGSPASASSLITYENPIFGYRITLPDSYRRLDPVLFTTVTPSGFLGRDTYTLLTPQQEREECLRDLGDLPSPSAAALLFVEVYRNPDGISASQWATTPGVPGAQPLSTHRKIEPLSLGGRDAVKLVADRATAETEVVVIRADDRIYVLTPTMWSFPPQHRLEDIAATFGTIAREPFPTPSPSPLLEARRQAANELAAALARAFGAKDADAVARLMPDCHLGVTPLIDGQGLANSGGGGLSRSVPLFTQALRDRFAAGDLTVTIDPTLQADGSGAGASLFVRSEWKETDRTTSIDLFLDLRDGRWQWVSARHHYRLADLGSPPCIPYRSPWVSGPTPGC